MTCAKRRVVCIIYPQSGRPVQGENLCNNPQPVCPREPDDDYSKCKTICDQQGHAEEQALATANRRGIDVVEALAEIYGHYWMCQNCGKTLENAGVAAVRIVNGPIPGWVDL